MVDGNKKDEYFPIRGDDQYEYFFDIWSNIHYGYVGASIGFDRGTLQFFANLELYLGNVGRIISGQADRGDIISVNIGVELLNKRGFELQRQDLHNSILANIATYFRSQDINNNRALDDSEISPVIGKLLPRTHPWSDGE